MKTLGDFYCTTVKHTTWFVGNKQNRFVTQGISSKLMYILKLIFWEEGGVLSPQLTA